MAAETVGGETPTLFLRKATGLVRGWSVRDSIIYACLATNFVTLGIYEFTFAGPAFPKGQLITAILISGVWVSFLVIAYSGLIVTIPRAGGDYVWQSRILGGGIGFVMAATGWWFILWLWAPIYGNILSVQLFQPLWATLGLTRRGGLVRHAHRDLRGLPDHDRPGGHPGLARHGRLRAAAALVLHRRHNRVRGHRRAAAGELAGRRSSARSTTRPRGSSASITRTRAPRRRRPRWPRTATRPRRWASARSARPCCWCPP